MDTKSDELPNGITREEIHHRRIDMRGFRRSDGLFEVQAHLTDRKTHDFVKPADGRTVPARAAVHDMSVALVFDKDMIVREVQTSMDAFPYRTCPGGGDSLQSLIGLRIGAGWNTEVRKRLPSADTCSHLKELLSPMASAAYQTMTSVLSGLLDERDSTGRPVKIGQCHAYGPTRDLVKTLWPEFHRTNDDRGAQG